ncbi:MAG: MgtC/SapB family protein [Gammaproteobacteria bacterium]|nr:MgtC/SapB family protein [Gammaproteobacteria bacterium]MBI5617694.1 MgtC/SapB family protein [Gammaproteobacteria bacterium]
MQWNGELAIGLAAALGAGLLIGIERERRKGSGAGRALAGVRTFALAALGGALAEVTGRPELVVLGGVLIVLLAVIAYFRQRSPDPGVTTELALFVTFLLGVRAIAAPAEAAAGAVVVAALLFARQRLHRFSTELLSAAEIRDALLLAGAALVVLPLVPVAPVAWLGGLDPRRLWLLLILLMAVQAAGYVAWRVLGARRGLAVSGLVSGFVSSTATIAALGGRAREAPELARACLCGALCSTVATPIEIGLIALAMLPSALPRLAAPLIAAALVALAAAALAWSRDDRSAPAVPPGRAFRMSQTLLVALLLGGATAVVGIANARFGRAGTGFGVAFAGFADAHAAAASVLALGRAGQLPQTGLAPFVLVGFTANSASRAVVACLAGGWRYGLPIAAGLAGIVAAAWAALALA